MNERLARRYPKRSPWDYLLYGGLAVGVGAVVYSAVVSGIERSNPPAQAMVRSFEVLSTTEIAVEILVQRPDPSREAQCLLTAQAFSYEPVGELTVTVPPTADVTSPHTFTLTTVKEPAAVDVGKCWLSD